jgi:excisionase family DNA binding protein
MTGRTEGRAGASDRQGPGLDLRPSEPTARLWTAEDVAGRWRVPTSQIYRLTREGRLPVVRVGRYYRYSPAAIGEFERSGGVSGC